MQLKLVYLLRFQQLIEKFFLAIKHPIRPCTCIAKILLVHAPDEWGLLVPEYNI